MTFINLARLFLDSPIVELITSYCKNVLILDIQNPSKKDLEFGFSNNIRGQVYPTTGAKGAIALSEKILYCLIVWVSYLINCMLNMTTKLFGTIQQSLTFYKQNGTIMINRKKNGSFNMSIF